MTDIQAEIALAHQRLADPQLRAYLAGQDDSGVKVALADLLRRVSPDLVVTNVVFGRRPLRTVTITWLHTANGVSEETLIDGVSFI